jgi:hypothetical protein
VPISGGWNRFGASGTALICDSEVSGVELEAGMDWRRGQAHGPELRGRVLAACGSGASVREVAERLMVSPSHVVKMRQRRDETGETVAWRGERVVAAVPHGGWKTSTFLAGLRADRVVAPVVLDGAINGMSFRTDVEPFLAPSLRPGDTVVIEPKATRSGTPSAATR